MPEGAELERRATELLQRLIQFNTVNPPGNEQAAQEWLRGLLEDAGFECEFLSAVEGRPNLVARLTGSSDSSSTGRPPRSASRIGAILTSALSPIRGIDACPARPVVRIEKRKTPFSATPPK